MFYLIGSLALGIIGMMFFYASCRREILCCDYCGAFLNKDGKCDCCNEAP